MATSATVVDDQKEEAPKSPLRRIVSFILNIITYTLLFSALALAALVAVIPRLQGGSSLTVLTQSMEPGLRPGDMVAIAPKNCQDMNIGDVLSYHPKPNDPTLITHRVIDKKAHGNGDCSFVMKGDNNSQPDKEKIVASTDPSKSMVVGKMIYSIPKFGFLAQGVAGGRAWLTPLLAGGLILAALYFLFAPEKKAEPQVVERIVYRDRPMEAAEDQVTTSTNTHSNPSDE